MNSHLHFTQSLEPLRGGGLGAAAANLHLSFLQNGFPSHLASTHSSPESIDLQNLITQPVKGPEKCFYSPTLLRESRMALEEANIFHGHGFYVYTNWAFGSYARRHHKHLVYHPHGFFEPWILNRSKVLKRVAHLLFENANFSHAGLWRALTPKEADQIKSMGVKAPIVVAPNGIHLEQFEKPGERSAELVMSKTRNRMLFMARLHPKKGLKMLLEVWATLPPESIRDWEIIVAGPDEDGHLYELQEVCRKHDLNDSVRFVGILTGEDKLAWLYSSDLFILPSYSEGFSVAVLEAMACNLPVIATSACNFPEIAEGGGWICEPDHNSLKDALLLAISSDQSQLRDRGNISRQLVESRYTWSKIAIEISDACTTHFK